MPPSFYATGVLNLKLGLIDQTLLICPMVINNEFVPPLTVKNFYLFFM